MKKILILSNDIDYIKTLILIIKNSNNNNGNGDN
jgi:hypothetical protein